MEDVQGGIAGIAPAFKRDYTWDSIVFGDGGS